MAGNRETFGSRLAFIMALAGSAIGLGNIWRFPYIVGEHGGAFFILVYLFFALMISLPILLAEGIIGKKSRRSTIDAMEYLAPGTGWKNLGYLAVAASFIILSFYSVVGGWSVDYLVRSCITGLDCTTSESAASIFGSVSGRTLETVVTFTVFLGLTAFIVFSGVKNGIERFSKVAMPVLFFLILFIAFYSLTLPGSMEGVLYLVKPDMSKVSLDTFSYALGQSFFSMSLGVGTVLTYSSYMRQEDSIVKTGIATTLSDLFFAIISGFAVMPAVFAAGIRPGAGPSLVFESLPYVFSCMSRDLPFIGAAVTVIFFLAILIAAVSSSISMFEVMVSHLIERKSFSRKKATIVVFAAAWVLGCLCALSFGVLSDFKILGKTIFSFCDVLTSNFLMMIGSLAFSLFAGWKMKKADVRSEVGPFFYFMIRWVAPVVIVVIFVANVLS